MVIKFSGDMFDVISKNLDNLSEEKGNQITEQLIKMPKENKL